MIRFTCFYCGYKFVLQGNSVKGSGYRKTHEDWTFCPSCGEGI